MSLNKEKNIVIYHPSNYFGGASVLFCRIFDYLSNNDRVYYIDCIDGYTKTNLGSRKNILIKTEDSAKIKKILNNNSTVILISSALSCFEKYKKEINLKSEPEVIIWVVHPYELSLIFFPFAKQLSNYVNLRLLKVYIRLFYFKYKKLKHELSLNEKIFFMDSSCKRASEYFMNTKLKDNYLPIPYRQISLPAKKETTTNKNIHLCYFGRVEDFKLKPLISLISDIKKSNENIRLHIIGDGKGLPKIKKKYSHGVDIKFLGTMKNEDAKKYIFENIDILFAMGTAALDGASLGVPTVLLNPSNTINKNSYYWLTKKNGYDLGDYVDAPWFDFTNDMSLKSILNEYNSNKENLSLEMIKLVKNRHSIDFVVNKLITLIK